MSQPPNDRNAQQGGRQPDGSGRHESPSDPPSNGAAGRHEGGQAGASTPPPGFDAPRHEQFGGGRHEQPGQGAGNPQGPGYPQGGAYPQGGGQPGGFGSTEQGAAGQGYGAAYGQGQFGQGNQQGQQGPAGQHGQFGQFGQQGGSPAPGGGRHEYPGAGGQQPGAFGSPAGGSADAETTRIPQPGETGQFGQAGQAGQFGQQGAPGSQGRHEQPGQYAQQGGRGDGTEGTYPLGANDNGPTGPDHAQLPHQGYGDSAPTTAFPAGYPNDAHMGGPSQHGTRHEGDYEPDWQREREAGGEAATTSGTSNRGRLLAVLGVAILVIALLAIIAWAVFGGNGSDDSGTETSTTQSSTPPSEALSSAEAVPPANPGTGEDPNAPIATPQFVPAPGDGAAPAPEGGAPAEGQEGAAPAPEGNPAEQGTDLGNQPAPEPPAPEAPAPADQPAP